MARREIGKLTINKSIQRQNKIIYPTMEVSLNFYYILFYYL